MRLSGKGVVRNPPRSPHFPNFPCRASLVVPRRFQSATSLSLQMRSHEEAKAAESLGKKLRFSAEEPALLAWRRLDMMTYSVEPEAHWHPSQATNGGEAADRRITGRGAPSGLRTDCNYREHPAAAFESRGRRAGPETFRPIICSPTLSPERPTRRSDLPSRSRPNEIYLTAAFTMGYSSGRCRRPERMVRHGARVLSAGSPSDSASGW